MKAAVFYGQENIKVKDIPIPKIGINDVLIKTKYCGICGSDVGAYRTGMYKTGVVIGHEFSGVIVEKGKNVKRYKIGDKVTAGGLIPCGECYFCKKRLFYLCEKGSYSFGLTKDGAMAEYIKLPQERIHIIPNDVSLKKAVLVDPLTDVIRAVKNSSLKINDKVLITGAGGLGLLALQYLKAIGVKEVFVSEINPFRIKLAKKLGAKEVINPKEKNLFLFLDKFTSNYGVDIIFDCSGASKVLQDSVTLVRRGGEVFVLSLCLTPVEIDFMAVVMRQVRIKASLASLYEDYPEAIKLIKDRKINPLQLITRIVSLEQVVEDGFVPLTKSESNLVKVIVQF